jgi:hypothetical protein
MCLILLCYFLVHLVWKLKKNPDNFCIPLLTGTGDLLGVILLFLCFHSIYLSGNKSVKHYPSLLTSTTSTTNTTNLNTFDI